MFKVIKYKYSLYSNDDNEYIRMGSDYLLEIVGKTIVSVFALHVPFREFVTLIVGEVYGVFFYITIPAPNWQFILQWLYRPL